MAIMVKKTKAKQILDNRLPMEKHPHENGARDSIGTGYCEVTGKAYAHHHATGIFVYDDTMAGAVAMLADMLIFYYVDSKEYTE